MLIYCKECSVARPPVDKPASASIMTHAHAKDLCASVLCGYRRYRSFLD